MNGLPFGNCPMFELTMVGLAPARRNTQGDGAQQASFRAWLREVAIDRCPLPPENR